VGPLTLAVDPSTGTIRRVTEGPDENSLIIEFKDYREVGPSLVHPFGIDVFVRERGGPPQIIQRVRVETLSVVPADYSAGPLVLPAEAVLMDELRGMMVDGALNPVAATSARTGRGRPADSRRIQMWVLAGAGLLFIMAAAVYSYRRWSRSARA
jgi:hypothetical protein